MQMPSFFDEVPILRVQDPLARVLGTAKDGVLEYSYADAAKLAGHSCPTVASAYWLSYLALEALYPDTLPQRGNIKVEFRDDVRTGSNGVAAAVIHMLTGAGGSTGFKGLAGRFSRANLLRHRPQLLLSLRYTRLDTLAAVDVSAELSLVPADPALGPLVERCGSGRLSAEEEQLLGELWQRRVARLFALARDPAVFIVRPVQQRSAGAVPRSASA